MEDKPNPANVGATPQEQFGIQNIYVKDVSFETPNSPQIFMEQGKPDGKFEVSTEMNQINETLYEVVLKATLTLKVGEKVAYLVEVHQAGLFAVQGFSQDRLMPMLHVSFPGIFLFPFVREAIVNLVIRGGFPPPTLPPVNFETLYAQRFQKQQQGNGKEKP